MISSRVLVAAVLATASLTCVACGGSGAAGTGSHTNGGSPSTSAGASAATSTATTTSAAASETTAACLRAHGVVPATGLPAVLGLGRVTGRPTSGGVGTRTRAGDACETTLSPRAESADIAVEECLNSLDGIRFPGLHIEAGGVRFTHAGSPLGDLLTLRTDAPGIHHEIDTCLARSGLGQGT